MRRQHVRFTLPLVCTLALLVPAPGGSRAQQLAITPPPSYAALEQDVAAEINLARTRPAEYAAFVEQLRAHYTGREFRQPGKTPLITEEGVAALDEAVRVLRSAKPVAALEVSPGMCSGAKALAAEQAAKTVRPNGRDLPSQFRRRLKREGSASEEARSL